MLLEYTLPPCPRFPRFLAPLRDVERDLVPVTMLSRDISEVRDIFRNMATSQSYELPSLVSFISAELPTDPYPADSLDSVIEDWEWLHDEWSLCASCMLEGECDDWTRLCSLNLETLRILQAKLSPTQVRLSIKFEQAKLHRLLDLSMRALDEIGRARTCWYHSIYWSDSGSTATYPHKFRIALTSWSNAFASMMKCFVHSWSWTKEDAGDNYTIWSRIYFGGTFHRRRMGSLQHTYVTYSQPRYTTFSQPLIQCRKRSWRHFGQGAYDIDDDMQQPAEPNVLVDRPGLHRIASTLIVSDASSSGHQTRNFLFVLTRERGSDSHHRC